MIKVICDKCGSNAPDDIQYHTVKIPCHVAERDKRGREIGYIDRHSNMTSGRLVDFHLCQKCANEAWKAMFDCIKAATVAGEKKRK